MIIISTSIILFYNALLTDLEQAQHDNTIDTMIIQTVDQVLQPCNSLCHKVVATSVLHHSIIILFMMCLLPAHNNIRTTV